jgi:radical SAM superfamily enzyme YgiQ (UPF0313 family)
VASAKANGGAGGLKVLLTGIYDTNTLSLAPQVLKAHAQRFDYARPVSIATREFSLFRHDARQIAEAINAEAADVVGLSVYVWNYTLILELIPLLRGRIIAGGPQLTGIERQLLARLPGLELVVTGEGEQAFVDLLRAFCGEIPLREVPGITTRELQNPPPPPLDLAELPLLYADMLAAHPGLSWISFQASRGCPFGCRYCCWGGSRRLRLAPLENVLAELTAILRQDSISSIYFCDSDILLDHERAVSILEYIIARKPGMDVRFEFNAEHLSDTILDCIERLPATEINFGLQTVNPKALENIGRKFRRNVFEQNFAKAAQRFAERITLDLIYGLPGDDYAGFKRSVEYALCLGGVRRILTNPLLVLPGSEFHRNMGRYGFVLRGPDSFLVESCASFSSQDMASARKLSFWVAVFFFNSALRDALLAGAAHQARPVTDVLLEFVSTLPEALLPPDYPDMVPGAREDYARRNAALAAVIRRYEELVAAFLRYDGGRSAALLQGFERSFTEQFRKVQGFISRDEAGA